MKTTNVFNSVNIDVYILHMVCALNFAGGGFVLGMNYVAKVCLRVSIFFL